MEKLFDSISKFVGGKLRDPFTNTFIIAWVVWNWKPVLFFIFSKTSAGKKIWIISDKYSDINHVLLYPLLATLLILILVPLISSGIEYVVQFIIKWRLQVLGNIAEKKNAVEDKVLAARAVGDVNKYISQLQEKISIYKKDLSSERSKNLEQVKEFNEERQKYNEEQTRNTEGYNKLSQQLESRIKELEAENKQIKDSIYYERESNSTELNGMEEKYKKQVDQLNELNRILLEHESDLTEALADCRKNKI